MADKRKFETGDIVWTRSQHYFLEGTNPTTGEDVELKLPRRDQLKVVSVDGEDVTVEVAGGCHAVLTKNDLDTIDD